MAYVFLLEACCTLPLLQQFITAPGCRPSAIAVMVVLCALAPLLIGLRLLVSKKAAPKWLWAVVPATALAWLVPTAYACVPPI